MIPSYAKLVKIKIERLSRVEIIYLVDKDTWIYPIVIMPKKNIKIRVCVDFKKLDVPTIIYPFPLPFIDSWLYEVARKEIKTF